MAIEHGLLMIDHAVAAMTRDPCSLLFKPYRLPFRQPLRTAHGSWTERRGLLVRLEDAGGRVGFGEVAPLPWFGTETLDEAEAVLRSLGGRVTPEVPGQVPERFGCVRFALACALQPLGGPGRGGRDQPAEVPLRPELAAGAGGANWPQAAAAGGTADGASGATRAPVRFAVAALLPAGRAALAELPKRLADGFLACKWKVAVGRPEDELAILDDLLAALPSYARLRLDANGGWDRRVAARWLERCAERPVEFVEQPVAPADADGLLGLAGDFPVTLALDESVVRLAEARRWQARGWPGVFVIKPALCGPLPEIEAWVRETTADVVLSSAIETALARAAIMRWALRSGVTKRALGFGVGDVFESAVANGPALGPLVGGAGISDAGSGVLDWFSVL